MSGGIPKFPPIGMGPDVWGPIFWTTMHIVSLGYPASPSKAEQTAAIAFYQSLTEMIPCPICKVHYRAHLAESPVESAVESRDALIFWVFTLHNKVNAQLGKREITFQEYIQNMNALASGGPVRLPQQSSATNALVGALAIAGIMGGAYYLYTTFGRK
jgi:hypothetical protein